MKTKPTFIRTIVTILIVLAFYNNGLGQTICATCPGNNVSGHKASAFGDNNTASGNYSFVAGRNSIANQSNAIVIGSDSRASGGHSYVIGSTTFALGNFSYAFGGNSTSESDFSLVLGHNLISRNGAFVIGKGRVDDKLINNQQESLMIGFNSAYPTLFVSRTQLDYQSGRIGIGNVTAPQAKLHIRGDAVEDATLLLEAQGSQSSIFTLAGQTGKIVFSGGSGNIGVAALQRPLNFFTTDRYGNAQLSMTIEGERGFVGIGTSAPKQRMHVNGNFLVEGNGSTILFAHEVNDPYWGKWGIEYWNGGLNFWQPYGWNYDRKDERAENFRLFLKDDGNVGIGTGNPRGKLDVHGNAMIRGDLYAEEVIVEDAADWPDYVFDDDYELMGLGELKDFITENRHLPGMPKADENGSIKNLKLIQLNTQLLKKIEELTLYMLEQEERIQRLEESTKTN